MQLLQPCSSAPTLYCSRAAEVTPRVSPLIHTAAAAAAANAAAAAIAASAAAAANAAAIAGDEGSNSI